MFSPFRWLRQLAHPFAIAPLLALLIALTTTQLMVPPAMATGLYSLPQTVSSDRWVIDDAEQISRINEGSLAASLKQLAEQTGNEVRFVTLHRLDYGETAQSIADQLMDLWFPTAEARAHQTIIVLDDLTNTMGIRVGEATGAILSDDIAQSVIDETMKVPLLRSNNYNQALRDGTDRLVAVLSGEEDPGAPVYDNSIDTDRNFATAEETEESRGVSTIVVVVLLIAATVIPMATYYWYVSSGG